MKKLLILSISLFFPFSVLAFSPPKFSSSNNSYELIVDDSSSFVLSDILKKGSLESSKIEFSQLDLGKGSVAYVTFPAQFVADVVRIGEGSRIQTLGNDIEIRARVFDGTEFGQLHQTKDEADHPPVFNESGYDLVLGAIDTRHSLDLHHGNLGSAGQAIPNPAGMAVWRWPNGGIRPDVVPRESEDGMQGMAGNAGGDGKSGGSILLVAHEFVGGGFITAGGYGGKGGDGAEGQQGGANDPEDPLCIFGQGEFTLPPCQEAYMYFLNNPRLWLPGVGGKGGSAGPGGRGGNGGAIRILAHHLNGEQKDFETTSGQTPVRLLRVADGGQPGSPGVPGRGGLLGDLGWLEKGNNLSKVISQLFPSIDMKKWFPENYVAMLTATDDAGKRGPQGDPIPYILAPGDAVKPKFIINDKFDWRVSR